MIKRLVQEGGYEVSVYQIFRPLKTLSRRDLTDDLDDTD